MDAQAAAEAFAIAMGRWSPLAIANVIAIALSPLIAVSVTLGYQHWREKRNSKMWVLNTLIGTRSNPLTYEAVRALNMIDITFSKDTDVRRLWREYFEMLNNQGLNNQLGYEQRQRKNLELITEMAAALGYRKEVTHLDVDRVYQPQGIVNTEDRNERVMNELLRVLQNTQGLQATQIPQASTGPRNQG